MKLAFFFILFLSAFSFTSAECSTNQIDINLASLEELDKLEGIGPTYAQRIIDTRPFNSLEDLLNVQGIGTATLQKIKDQGLACFSNSSEQIPIEANSSSEKTESNSETISLTPQKVELNSASSKELEKITGVGPKTALAIIEARPFSSLEDLLNVKGIGEASLEKIKQQGLAWVDETELEKSIPEENISMEKKQEETSQLSQELETEKVINLNSEAKSESMISGKVVYESKTEKVRKYAIYAFSIVLVFILFLILKN